MAFDSSQQFFESMQKRIESDEAAKASLQAIGATYQFCLTGDNASDWTLNLSEGSVAQGLAAEPGVKLTVSDDHFLQMVNGEVQGQQLFMQGLIMLEGDFSLAMQLEQVFSAAG